MRTHSVIDIVNALTALNTPITVVFLICRTRSATGTILRLITKEWQLRLDLFRSIHRNRFGYLCVYAWQRIWCNYSNCPNKAYYRQSKLDRLITTGKKFYIQAYAEKITPEEALQKINGFIIVNADLRLEKVINYFMMIHNQSKTKQKKKSYFTRNDLTGNRMAPLTMVQEHFQNVDRKRLSF